MKWHDWWQVARLCVSKMAAAPRESYRQVTLRASVVASTAWATELRCGYEALLAREAKVEQAPGVNGPDTVPFSEIRDGSFAWALGTKFLRWSCAPGCGWYWDSRRKQWLPLALGFSGAVRPAALKEITEGMREAAERLLDPR